MSTNNDADILIQVGVTRCTIKVSNGVILNHNLIDDSCSFPVPNAKYTERFKRGEWDGKYHLYKKYDKSFPTGLLQRVMDALEIYRLKYKLQMLFEEPQVCKFDWELVDVDFRPYQNNAIESAYDNKNGIIQIPTGGGKTLVAAGIIQKFGVKTLLLCCTTDILYQNYNVLKAVLPNAKIGIIGDGNLEIGDINVAMVQTIAPKIPDIRGTHGDTEYDNFVKYGDDEPLVVDLKPTEISAELVKQVVESSELLIFDECHHISCATFYKIAMYSKSILRFGLSASPKRDDGFDMKIEAGVGSIIYKISISELIRFGYLARPNIHFIAVPPKAYPKNAKYIDVYHKYIVNNDSRNAIIQAISLEQMKKGKKTLIITKEIPHINILNKLIPESVIVYGKIGSNERLQILEDFRQHNIGVLIGTSVADEGIDLPSVECLILGGAGKSLVKTIQRLGRALRLSDRCPNPKCHSYDVRIKGINDPCICKKCGQQWEYNGKREVDVYDFQDNTRKWLFDHYLIRKSIYEQEEEFDISFRRIEIKTN